MLFKILLTQHRAHGGEYNTACSRPPAPTQALASALAAWFPDIMSSSEACWITSKLTPRLAPPSMSLTCCDCRMVGPGGGRQPQQVVVFPEMSRQEQVGAEDGDILRQVPHGQVRSHDWRSSWRHMLL
ncbi:hypothetical protein EYF80_051419 [Liparis tanakae]|uniref:Uncharacterized protein n=1 Tax=Liparis tanakae TaxID=230148 RepID=A0A4Z2FB50_9TELE|nr:hypothetical protein EYF80_051419 [Liparis tanakae]